MPKQVIGMTVCFFLKAISLLKRSTIPKTSNTFIILAYNKTSPRNEVF